MGQNSSKSPPQNAPNVAPIGFQRAQTMLDVSHALADENRENRAPGMKKCSSDTALNTSGLGPAQKSYQQALEWGRNEHFFKLAHTFHTNNY